MIKNLSGKSRITEVDATSRRMIGAFRNSAMNADEKLNAEFGKMQLLSQRLRAAILPDRTLSQLKAADHLRVKKLRDLFYLIKGFAHYPDPALADAALKIQETFGKYGLNSISRASYAIKSSLLGSLLRDLSKEELQEAIALLPGCGENIAALKVAQQSFESTRIGYEASKAEERQREKALAIKDALLTLINRKLIPYLNGMLALHESYYGVFARHIAQIITHNNEEVAKRNSGPSTDTDDHEN